MKTKIKRRYNYLVFEERKIIHFYILEQIIQTLNQILIVDKEDISPRLKRKLDSRIKTFKKYLKDEYDVEE